MLYLSVHVSFKSSTFYLFIFCFICLLVFGGGTPSGTQGLLLALHPEIAPGRRVGPYGMPGIKLTQD